MRCLAVLLLASLALAQEDLVAELLELEAPVRDYETDLVAKAYGKPDPPPDDAPLHELLDYWAAWRWRLPTAAVRERMLAACKADPELLAEFAEMLPRTEEVRELLARWAETAHGRIDESWLEYAVDTLTPEPADAFAELVRSDWPRAEPLARELIGGDDEELEVAALVALFEHGDATMRPRLRAVVEQAGYGDEPRNHAFSALAAAPFAGFEAWCLTFLDDGELDLFPAVRARPDRWVPILARHVEDKRPDVRARAIGHLLRLPPRADALRPLLPWLADPAWSETPKRGRMRLIRMLGEIDVPESVPGLLKVLAGDEEAWVVHPALRALARLAPKEAVPLLRARLPSMSSGLLRQSLCLALLRCGALSRDEQIEAIVAYGRGWASGRLDRWCTTGANAQEALGRELARAHPTDDAILTALLEKSAEMPVLAGMVHEWPGASSDLDIVRRLARGDVKAASIAEAMKRREQVKEHAASELMRLRDGVAGGVAAALLGETERVLKGDDRAAQRGLLASARVVRMELPVDAVARLLPDTAARAYLEALDTAAARAPLKGIVGWGPRPEVDHEARARMGDAREVFVLARSSVWSPGDSRITVAIHDDHATLTWSDRPGRFRWRALDLAEARRFAAFVKRHRIDELAPVIQQVEDASEFYYLHLTPERGWRVYLGALMDIEETDIYGALLGRFHLLGAAGGFQSRYGFDEQFGAVEVLLSGGVFEVWANGDDIRVFRDEWETLDGKEVEAPVRDADLMCAPRSGDLDREMAGGKTLRWTSDRGISLEEGGKDIWLFRGKCRWPLLTPNRKWLVVAIAQDSWRRPNGLLRVDLASGEVSDVDLPARAPNHPLAWLPAHRKMLVRHGEGCVLLDPATGRTEEVKGAVWPFTQETPELHREQRRLQPTGKPFEYWAAKSDRKGSTVVRFDTKTFRVSLERYFPGLAFYTRQMHVDGDQLYLAYEGDLLRLPLR